VQILAFIQLIQPAIDKAMEAWKWAQTNLPIDLVIAAWGLILCFFGGTFPLVLGAYEAFKISGWDTSRAAIADLVEQSEQYRRASEVDDVKDDDNDGVADVDQLSTTELVQVSAHAHARTHTHAV